MKTLLLFVWVLLFAGTVYFIRKADEPVRTNQTGIAKVDAASGAVLVRSANAVAWEEAARNNSIFEGDHISTGARSRVTIRFNDDRKAELGENSYVILSQDASDSQSSSIVTVLKGDIKVAEAAPRPISVGGGVVPRSPKKLVINTATKTIVLNQSSQKIELSQDADQTKVTVVKASKDVVVNEAPKAVQKAMLASLSGAVAEPLSKLTRATLETLKNFPALPVVKLEAKAVPTLPPVETAEPAKPSKEAKLTEIASVPPTPSPSPEPEPTKLGDTLLPKIISPTADQILMSRELTDFATLSIDVVVPALPPRPANAANAPSDLKMKVLVSLGRKVVDLPLALRAGRQVLKFRGELNQDRSALSVDLRMVTFVSNGRDKIFSKPIRVRLEKIRLDDRKTLVFRWLPKSSSGSAGVDANTKEWFVHASGLRENAAASSLVILRPVARQRLVQILASASALEVESSNISEGNLNDRGVVFLSGQNRTALAGGAAAKDLGEVRRLARSLSATAAYRGGVADFVSDVTQFQLDAKSQRISDSSNAAAGSLFVWEGQRLVRVASELLQQNKAAMELVIRSAKLLFNKPVEVIPLSSSTNAE